MTNAYLELIKKKKKRLSTHYLLPPVIYSIAQFLHKHPDCWKSLHIRKVGLMHLETLNAT